MDGEYPIRILHVLTAMNRAGTETLLMNYYRAVDRSKVQFDFAVSADGESDYDKEIEEMGGRIIHYPRYRVSKHGAYKKWWNDFFKSHSEYKIVHGHIGSTAAIYLKIAKKYGCYTIAHSHSTTIITSLRDVLYTVYSRPTRNIADYFFGCSARALSDRYGKKVAGDRSRSRVLYNAVDAERFVYSEETRKRIRTEFGIPEDKLVVGTVGRLVNEKNPKGILEIIRLLDERKTDFVFMWVGRGDCEGEIKSYLEQHGLTDKALMLGVRDNVNEFMQAMDVFILPSLYEGLGNVLIEAQAAGLPSICSDRVPLDAKVSELFRRLPLSDYSAWCDLITSVNVGERKNMYAEIVNSGYDVKQNAEELQRFYLSKVR